MVGVWTGVCPCWRSFNLPVLAKMCSQFTEKGDRSRAEKAEISYQSFVILSTLKLWHPSGRWLELLVCNNIFVKMNSLYQFWRACGGSVPSTNVNHSTLGFCYQCASFSTETHNITVNHRRSFYKCLLLERDLVWHLQTEKIIRFFSL